MPNIPLYNKKRCEYALQIYCINLCIMKLWKLLENDESSRGGIYQPHSWTFHLLYFTKFLNVIKESMCQERLFPMYMLSTICANPKLSNIRQSSKSSSKNIRCSMQIHKGTCQYILINFSPFLKARIFDPAFRLMPFKVLKLNFKQPKSVELRKAQK